MYKLHTITLCLVFGFVCPFPSYNDSVPGYNNSIFSGFSQEERADGYLRDKSQSLRLATSSSPFKYSNLFINPPKVFAGVYVNVTFNVANTGSRDADEVVEVYISWLNTTVSTPLYQLVGWKRLRIQKGASVPCLIVITSDQYSVVLKNGSGTIIPGTVVVYVGDQLPNQQSTGGSNILKGTFQIYTSDKSVKNTGGQIHYSYQRPIFCVFAIMIYTVILNKTK